MNPLDANDDTMLVWSDWLEEDGQEDKAQQIREETVNDPESLWQYEYRSSVGSIVGGSIVGGSIVVGGIVGVGGGVGVGGVGGGVVGGVGVG